MPRRRQLVIFAAMFVLTFALDQGSKAWAQSLPAGVRHPVIAGYWDWELAANPGSAFSTFAGVTGARVALTAIGLIALVALAVAVARTTPEQRLRRAGYALVVGGALGNLVDRVRLGAVTDFVRWHVHDHMWPIFNVADAALLFGVAFLLADSALAHREKLRASSSAT